MASLDQTETTFVLVLGMAAMLEVVVQNVNISLPPLVWCRISMRYTKEKDEHCCPLPTILSLARSCIDGARYAIS